MESTLADIGDGELSHGTPTNLESFIGRHVGRYTRRRNRRLLPSKKLVTKLKRDARQPSMKKQRKILCPREARARSKPTFLIVKSMPVCTYARLTELDELSVRDGTKTEL
ncbi:hypothetical protein V1478_012410 [Vespula squamosa]|uniref:Uncharacterized protein n=1 Tax=Vespula squamosa TaxID=30214 RepID=A0ABD2AD38_VESSQ